MRRVVCTKRGTEQVRELVVPGYGCGRCHPAAAAESCAAVWTGRQSGPAEPWRAVGRGRVLRARCLRRGRHVCGCVCAY